MIGDWKKISGNRYVTQADGYRVIVPGDLRPTAPLYCPVCETPMRISTDVSYYEMHSCCTRCAVKWAEGTENSKRWSTGWRPSSAEIKAELAARSATPYASQ